VRKMHVLDQQAVGSSESRELIVEDVEARGMYAMSLAEAEISSRNTCLDITGIYIYICIYDRILIYVLYIIYIY
jgi:hypothetical protein